MGVLFGANHFLDVYSGGGFRTNKGTVDLSVVNGNDGYVTQEIVNKYGADYGGPHYNCLRLKNAQDVIAMKLIAGTKLIIFIQGHNEIGTEARIPKISKNADMSNPLNEAPGENHPATVAGFRWEYTVADDGLYYIGSYNGDMFVSFIIVEVNTLKTMDYFLENFNLDAPMGKSVYAKVKNLVDRANEAKALGDEEAMNQLISEIRNDYYEIFNSIALFSSLVDAIENETNGLNVVISNSTNNIAKTEATNLANTILSDIENHNIEDSEVEGLLNQINAMKDRLNMRCGGLYYNFITKAKVAEVIGNPDDKYTGSIIIPETVDFEGNTYSIINIRENAFAGCTGLTSVTIPNSVTSIGVNAFLGCSGLSNVTIPNSVTSIGNSAFNRCSSLTSVIIPNSVTSIGGGAFYGCSGLTSVSIGNSVTSIGPSSFRECSGLTSVTIPNSVTNIGAFAFTDCI